LANSTPFVECRVTVESQKGVLLANATASVSF